MINRKTLLAAAAIMLPTAIAGAQTPLTATASNPHAARRAPRPPAHHPVTPAGNTATEDTQTRQGTPDATNQATDPVDTNAEPGTQGEVTTQTQAATQVQTATPPEPQQPAPAPAQADAQTQTQTQAQTQAQAQPSAQAGPVTLATAADVHAGVPVRDPAGGMVGTVESVDATGAVIATGTARAKLPLASFGRNNQGLVISLTRAQLEAAAQQPQPVPSAS